MSVSSILSSCTFRIPVTTKHNAPSSTATQYFTIHKTPPRVNVEMIAFQSTPQGRKMERIIKQPLYQDINNAGRLAIALACQVFFGDEVMHTSSLSGHLGKYNVLEEEKLAQIQDTVWHMCRPNEGKVLWSKCREAIGKKCQSMCSKASTN